MSIQSNFSGSIQLTDPNTGTVQLYKALAALYTGTISTVAESLAIGTATSVIALPISPTQLVYVKNLHATNTVIATWTPNGGSSAVVCTLQPGSMILMNEANATSGITAFSLSASGASTPVDYVLVG